MDVANGRRSIEIYYRKYIDASPPLIMRIKPHLCMFGKHKWLHINPISELVQPWNLLNFASCNNEN